jgi:3-hydroxybutyrate dehydrogenase
MMLRGKSALISGSTSGLGLAIADQLAGEGCNIVLNGLAEESEAAKLRDELARRHGVEVVFHGANLADPAQIADMMQHATMTFGHINVLVNNAVVRHFAPVEEFPVERWNEALAVNLSAAFHTIRLALPAMRREGWGRIVNVASVYSFFATPNRIDYVTTKTALLGLTRTVALETSGTDITCNAICPGTLPTPAIKSRIERIAAEQNISVEEATRDYLGARQPGGRFIPMETVTGLVAFLCGPASAGINGAALPIDSGWTVS